MRACGVRACVDGRTDGCTDARMDGWMDLSRTVNAPSHATLIDHAHGRGGGAIRSEAKQRSERAAEDECTRQNTSKRMYEKE